MSDFDWLFKGGNLETSAMPEMRSITRTLTRRAIRTDAKDILANIAIFPAIGESIHMITNGIFDFFTLADILINSIGGTEHLYASTWTINQETIIDLFDYFDYGKIKQLNILSDKSFKRRKPANYAMIVDGLRERGQRYIASDNHSKVVLLNNEGHYITIECSASFTKNPRLEQHVITNDKALWEFHRTWMEWIYENGKT